MGGKQINNINALGLSLGHLSRVGPSSGLDSCPTECFILRTIRLSSDFKALKTLNVRTGGGTKLRLTAP